MSKKKKKAQPVQMKQKEKPMIIDMNALQLKAGHQIHANFRSGAHMTAKDRPRDKSYKRGVYSEQY